MRVCLFVFMVMGASGRAWAQGPITVVAPTTTAAGSLTIKRDIAFPVTRTGVLQIIVFDNWVTSDGNRTSLILSGSIRYTKNGTPGSFTQGNSPTDSPNLLFDNLTYDAGSITPDDGYIQLQTQAIGVAADDVFVLKSGTYVLPADSGAGQFNRQANQTFAGKVFLTNSNGVRASSSVQLAVPSVTTPTSANVSATGATLGGNVSDDGGVTLVERGVVVAPSSANADPIIGGANVVKFPASGPATTGVFTAAVTGLSPSTNYSFKAYVTNSGSTSYSPVATFSTGIADPTGAARFVVTTTQDVVAFDGLISLREAISNASGAAGDDTISFASPLFDSEQTISLKGGAGAGELSVNSNIAITGNGARLLRVERPSTATSDFRVFNLANNTVVTLSGMTIAGGRTGGQAGGILKGGGGSLRLDGVSVQGNAVTGGSGGGLDTFALTNILNSTFSGNSSFGGISGGGNGGAIRVAGGVTVNIADSTFSGNSSSSFGGAIASSGALSVSDTTLTLNSAAIGGGGIFIQGGTLGLNNSLVAGNTANDRNPDVSGTINAGDYNLIGNPQGTTFPASATHNKTNVDAMLGPLKDNGSQTDTHAPALNSPAVDAGNSTLSTDQRGRFRPVDFPNIANATGGNGSDIGSFELNESGQSGPNFVVNKTDDHDDGVCGPTDCTLREAINAGTSYNAANSNAGVQISFDATVFAARQTISPQTSFPTLTSNISINGPTSRGAGVTLSLPGNGSGVLVSGGTVGLAGLTFSSSGDGYGVQNTFGNGSGGNLTVSGCTFSDNFIGLVFTAGTTTVSNCTFSGNRKGIVAFNSCFIDNSTLSGNRDGLTLNGFNVTATVSNSIIAGNETNVYSIGGDGTVNDAGHNILSGTTVDAGLENTGPTSPVLKPNGGPTDTIALLSTSPAIDAGNSNLTTDGRGLKRPVDIASVDNAQGSNGSDIGSFELQDIGQSAPNFVVNSIDDHDDGVCGVNDCTLREAVGAANRNGAGTDTISFDSTLFGSKQIIKLTLGEISITASVSIEGPGARLLSIDGGGTSRIFGIGAGNLGNTWQTGPAGSMTTISGLSLVNGNSGNGDGGAITSNENLVLNSCTLSGNRAGRGGAIFSSGTLALNGCTLSGNGANNFGGAIVNEGTLTLNSCTLSGNHASDSQSGGAISSAGTRVTLDSCTLSGNRAGTGGAIFIGIGALNLRNSIVAGNTAGTNPDISGTINSGDYNLIGNTRGAIFSGNPANNKTNVDAKLDTLKPNGGPTDTIALLPGSPAINAGDPSITSGFDQRGNGFPRVKGGRVDIGSFEAQNSAPVAKDNSYDATEDVLLSVNAANGVLSNDSDPDANTTLSIVGNTNTTNGTLSLNKTDGAFTYQPNANFFGNDSFSYTVSDGSLSATATVDIAVSEVNDAPTLDKPADVSVQEDAGTQTVNLSGISSGPANEIGQTLVVTATSDNAALVANPTVVYTSPNTSGTLSFSSASNASGTATITVSVADNGTSNSAADAKTTTQTFVITVNAVNDAPTAKDDFYSTAFGMALNVSAPGVLSGDSDIEGNTLSVADNDPTTSAIDPVTSPKSGALILRADGSFSYTPNAGFTGDDSFQYKVSDGQSANSLSNIATVTLRVAANVPPVAVDDSASTPEDQFVDINVISNDTDADGGTLSVSAASIADVHGGTATPQADGKTVRFQPSLNANDGNTPGGFGFSYKTNDGTSDSLNTATVTVKVSAVNNAPVIQSVSIAPQTPKTNDVLKATVAATDVENDSITFSFVWKKNGVVIEGEVTDTLDLSKTGNGDKGDTISVEVVPNDGTANGTPATASITVGNTAPVVTSVSITPRRPNTSSILTANPVATDADGDTLSFSFVWKKNGVVIPNETGATLDLSKPGNGDERDRITVSVTAFDGTDKGNTLTSASVTVFNFAPMVVSVSPQGATDKVGDKRTFVLTASDPNGASDITGLSLFINQKLDTNSGAFLRYDINSGLLFLKRGDAFLPGIPIGSAASATDVLDNGALRINGIEVSFTSGADGLSLSLSVPATVRGGLVGTNILFGRAQDAAGASSSPHEGGFVRSGTYVVAPQFPEPPNNIPTVSQISPKDVRTLLPVSGVAANVQPFVFYARDEDGAADLDSLQFLAGRTRTGKGTANFVFFPRTRRLYLRSDDGRTLLGGMLIGTAGILENSQVRLDVSKAQFLIYPDGKSLGLRLPIGAKTGLLGQNKVWLRVQDRGGALAVGGDSLGYVLSGTWNVTAPAKSASPSGPSSGNS